MIDDHIARTEEALKAVNIPDDKKADLLGLLPKLKSAIGDVSQTHDEHAENIARLVAASAHETFRPEKKPEKVEESLQGLRQSVDGFEASHPHLFAAVNEFATVLSSMGF